MLAREGGWECGGSRCGPGTSRLTRSIVITHNASRPQTTQIAPKRLAPPGFWGGASPLWRPCLETPAESPGRRRTRRKRLERPHTTGTHMTEPKVQDKARQGPDLQHPQGRTRRGRSQVPTTRMETRWMARLSTLFVASLREGPGEVRRVAWRGLRPLQPPPPPNPNPQADPALTGWTVCAP